VLLQTQHDVDGHTPEDHPLAQYAARHWTTHTQFEDVSSRLRKGMEYLFDRDKPHFQVWVKLFNIDIEPGPGCFRLYGFDKFTAGPLYYAALCGFYDLVERLIIKYPEEVNAVGGQHVQPLVAALAEGHLQTADLLRHRGADPHFRTNKGRTVLHFAAYYGNIEVAKKLIEYGADVRAEDGGGITPFHLASEDVNARAKDGSTPLYIALLFANPEVVRLLLDHGADVNARLDDFSSPLHRACSSVNAALEVVRLLLERGADVKAKDNHGNTALQAARARGENDVVKLLLEYGAR